MSAYTVYTQAPGTILAANGNSGSLNVGNYNEMAADANITAVSGSTPTLQLFIDREGADGVWYPIWQSSTLTSTTQVSTSIGPGTNIAQFFGSTIRWRWVVGGGSPSFTLSSSIIAK